MSRRACGSRTVVGGLAANGPRPLRDMLQRFSTLVRIVGVVAALKIARERLGDPTSDRIFDAPGDNGHRPGK